MGSGPSHKQVDLKQNEFKNVVATSFILKPCVTRNVMSCEKKLKETLVSLQLDSELASQTSHH